MRVLDADGKQVDKGDAHVDPKDQTLLAVNLPLLKAGTYKVVWGHFSGHSQNRGRFPISNRPIGH
jgi:methionine-rich copper-binding protein CopC